MVILILENVRPTLRGELSRWLCEVKSGVFVGKASALVREELWQLVGQQLGKGSAVMVHPANNEQGFSAKTLGNPTRRLVDIEGLFLVRT